MGIPQYTKDAINKYNNKFDRIYANMPKGSKEEIKELTGKSGNQFLVELGVAELERLRAAKSKPEPVGQAHDDDWPEEIFGPRPK